VGTNNVELSEESDADLLGQHDTTENEDIVLTEVSDNELPDALDSLSEERDFLCIRPNLLFLNFGCLMGLEPTVEKFPGTAAWMAEIT
jgi:hypothetical protein